jgi:hypothetical protein
MMCSFEWILVSLLSALGGIGVASIGGLPGAPKGRTEEGGLIWVPWGGRHLKIPEIEPSQRAFDQGAYDHAYRSLRKVRRSIKQGCISETPIFEIQLYNNLAVSAHRLSQLADDARKQQRLRNLARYYITCAAQIPTSSRELSRAIRRNIDLIDRVW